MPFVRVGRPTGRRALRPHLRSTSDKHLVQAAAEGGALRVLVAHLRTKRSFTAETESDYSPKHPSIPDSLACFGRSAPEVGFVAARVMLVTVDAKNLLGNSAITYIHSMNTKISTKREQRGEAAIVELRARLAAFERAVNSATDSIDENERRTTFIPIPAANLRTISRVRARLAALCEETSAKKKSKPAPHPIQANDITFLTETMLATRWHCSRSRLQHWRLAAKGPRFVKLEGRVLYALADVLAFEAERRSS